MKEKFITSILEDLKRIEKTLQELERDDVELELWTRREVEHEPNQMHPIVGGVSVAEPLFIKSDSIIYKNIVSLLKAEAVKLKEQLKDELGIDGGYSKKDIEI